MPLLRLNETFSSEALELTEEFGGKAGLLKFLAKKNPRLADFILPGVYLTPGNITVQVIREILESKGVREQDQVYRSSHSDDIVAFIGGIDNLNPTQDIAQILADENELVAMKQVLLTPEEKGARLKLARDEYDRIHNEAKQIYPFLFEMIDMASEEWGFLEAPVFALNSMLIAHLEGIIRVIQYHSGDKYDDTMMFDSGEEIYMYPGMRRGHEYKGDESVKKFSQFFHDNSYTIEFDKKIREFVDGKSIDEITAVIVDLKKRDIPGYYGDYVTADMVDEMLLRDVYTQSQVDEKEASIETRKNKDLGSGFIKYEGYLSDYIVRNNLRPLEETGLYIQEKLGDNWSFGTMLEHPHIPGKFIFSGRGGPLNDAHPSYYTVGGEVIQGTIPFPMKKFVELYEEIKKTGLLIDDISLQIEIASRGSDVYILQVRAFRKKETVSWKRDDLAVVSDYDHIFGVTPEEGISVGVGEGDFFDKNIGGQIDLIRLQALKLAVSDCSAPFDHELTEVAYYPEIAIFGRKIEDIMLREGDYRVISNGESYRIERNY